MPYTTAKYTANADIRTYMTDNLVSQSKLAESMGISVWKVNAMLKTELSQREKEDILRRIDAIAAERLTEDPSPMGGAIRRSVKTIWSKIQAPTPSSRSVTESRSPRNLSSSARLVTSGAATPSRASCTL